MRIFSKAAAIQYAPDKIRVNSVHPGFVDTPMTVPGHSNPDVARKRIEVTPLGRFGTPYDIAAGCLYLASDEFVVGDRQRAGDRRRHDGELMLSDRGTVQVRIDDIHDADLEAPRSGDESTCSSTSPRPASRCGRRRPRSGRR